MLMPPDSAAPPAYNDSRAETDGYAPPAYIFIPTASSAVSRLRLSVR